MRIYGRRNGRGNDSIRTGERARERRERERGEKEGKESEESMAREGERRGETFRIQRIAAAAETTRVTWDY